MNYPPSLMNCADCNCLLRVSGPCLHGGEWRCWNCVPAAKERQAAPPTRWGSPSPHAFDGRWRWLGLKWSGKVPAGRRKKARGKRLDLWSLVPAPRPKIAVWKGGS